MQRGLAWPFACRGAQNFEFDSQPTKNVSLHVTAFKGATYVTPAQYMDFVLAMQPDFYIALADETHGHLTKRRAENACKRSLAWLQECLQRSEAHNAALPAGAPPVAAVGSVVGCAVSQQGRRVAQGVAAHDAQLSGARRPALCSLALCTAGRASRVHHTSLCARVRRRRCLSDFVWNYSMRPVWVRAGYYIAGHGVGESPAERRQTLATVTGDLPAARLRYVSLVGGVDEILENVAVGVDVLESRCGITARAARTLRFPAPALSHAQGPSTIACLDAAWCVSLHARTCAFFTGASITRWQLVGVGIARERLLYRYALEATAAGQALVLSWPDAPPRKGAASVSDDGRKLSLRAPAYKEDAGPILQGCTCYACQNHSRCGLMLLLPLHKQCIGIASCHPTR